MIASSTFVSRLKGTTIVGNRPYVLRPPVAQLLAEHSARKTEVQISLRLCPLCNAHSITKSFVRTGMRGRRQGEISGGAFVLRISGVNRGEICVEKRLKQALRHSGFANTTFGIVGCTSPHCFIVAQRKFQAGQV